MFVYQTSPCGAAVPSSFSSAAKAVARTAHRHSLLLQASHRVASPLADGPPFPLCNESQDVQHEPPHRRARVERFTDGQERILLLGEGPSDEPVEIEQGASEPIQLHREERVCSAALQPGKR